MKAIHLKTNNSDQKNLEAVKRRFGVISTAEALRISLRLTAEGEE